MSDLNGVSQAIGALQSDVRNLTSAVEKLTGTVEGLQKTKWTARGLLAGLSLAGGAAGSKLLAIFGGSPPPQH